MRGLATTAALLGAGLLALSCADEPAPSADDDDGYGVETTVGGTTASSVGSGGASATSGNGGAAMNSSAASGAGGAGGTPISAGDLVITEVMNNPAAVLDNDGEWFEIHNATSQPIDLQGITIIHAFGATTGHIIASPVIVQPQGFAVLGRNGDYNVNGGAQVDYVYGGSVSLNNTYDYLALVSSESVVIDETSWDELSGLDPDGASRNLDPQAMSATMNDDDTHFCEAVAIMPYGDRGTPGGSNDVCP